MSNLEKHPAEVSGEGEPGPIAAIEILRPRDVPLGGPRAMPVRRTLPQRSRSLIGAWCFVDHYGPDAVATSGGMVVPPHPHTGLQTVSWLFTGEIEHRDSVGSHAMVRPGEINLMTAGSGIAHSEVSTPATTTLHGAQLWLALPDSERHREPFFEHFAPEPVRITDATIRVFIGSLAGSRSPVAVYTPLVGAELVLEAGAVIDVPVDAGFEHGILLDIGDVTVQDTTVGRSELAYVAPGVDTIRLAAGAEGARVLLIGGEPFGERIVMWWNFIGRTHEEVVAYRADWQGDVIDGGRDDGRFGLVRGYDGSALPAPVLPNVRLKPRE